jgi:hypothetical protein
MQDPLGAQTTVYFDKFGHEVQNIDPLGRVTSSTHDTAWRRERLDSRRRRIW